MSEETKKCPYCGEEILKEAKKCKHCGEWLVVQEKDKPKASMHLAMILEILIAILSVPIGLMKGSDDAISFIIVAYIGLNLYFLPTLIADWKRTQYTLAIFAINLLLGVTVIGWVGVLIWAIILPNLSQNEENTVCDDSETKTYTQAKNSNEQIQENRPNNIKQWNWGAFWLSWIWGIANKSYLSFLALIPVFGYIWMFVCGAKGNEWAWKNKNWGSVDEFNEIQRKWAIVGNCIAIPLLVSIPVIILLVDSLDPKAKEIRSFINNATSVQYREDSYYKYYTNSDKEEYCTNIELVEGKPFKTKCSSDTSKLKDFRHCYQERSIGSVFSGKGATAFQFAKLAEYNGVRDPKYAAEIGMFNTCEYMVDGVYTKTQEEITLDIKKLKQQIQEAQENNVTVTCYFDYLNQKNKNDISTCKKEDIENLDKNFNTKRDESGNRIYTENLDERVPVVEERGDIIEQVNEYTEEKGDIIDTAEEDYKHVVNENQKQKQINNIAQPIKHKENTNQNNTIAPQTQQNNQDVDDFMN